MADCKPEPFSTKETDAIGCTRVEREEPLDIGAIAVLRSSYICPCKQHLPCTYESQVSGPRNWGLFESNTYAHWRLRLSIHARWRPGSRPRSCTSKVLRPRPTAARHCPNALPRAKLKSIYLIQRTATLFTYYVLECAMPCHGSGRTSCAFSHVDAYACAGPVPVPLVIRRALSASADEGFGVWSRDWEEMRQGDGTAN